MRINAMIRDIGSGYQGATCKFLSEEVSMRTIVVLIAATAVTVVGAVTSALAAPRPTFAACEVLSEQRGSGGSDRTHRTFMADCLAGKIQFSTGVRPPTPAQASQVQSNDRCEALAESRGSTTGRDHRTFINQCMAGRIR
jgi:hypothetical protein